MPQGVNREITEKLRQAVESLNPSNLAEMNVIAAQVMGLHNSSPREDLGGLSPDQVMVLSRRGWLDQMLRQPCPLSPSDLSHSHYFTNAMCVLKGVEELGVVKATATGAFSRPFVLRMAAEFQLDAVFREIVVEGKTQLRQADIRDLEMMRHLLPMAGLMLYRNGHFTVTRKTSVLIANQSSGEIYSRIVRAFFDKFNMAALDGLDEVPAIQHNAGYTLYKLHLIAGDWVNVESIAKQLFHPDIAASLPPCSWSTNLVADYVRLRIVRHLIEFGLLESQGATRRSDYADVRKSPLFDRFFTFEFVPSAHAAR